MELSKHTQKKKYSLETSTSTCLCCANSFWLVGDPAERIKNILLTNGAKIVCLT